MADSPSVKLRIAVKFGEEKMIVPISTKATIKQLMKEAQRRIAKHKGNKDFVIKELRLEKDGSILFQEDEVGEVLNSEDVLICTTKESKKATSRSKKDNKEAQRTDSNTDAATSKSDVSSNETAQQSTSSSNANPQTQNLDGEDDDSSTELRPTNAAVTSAYIPPPTLLFETSEVDFEFRYRTVTDKTTKSIKCPLSTTLEAFKQLIAKQEGKDISSLAVDLHTAVTPILCTKAMHELTISQLGLHKLSAHNYLAFANVEQKPEFDTTIYVSFRTISNDEDRYARNPLPNNFDFDDAWQPIQSIQTEKGMSAFLSGLYVLSAHMANSTDIQRFMGHTHRRFSFPPALNTLAFLLKNKLLFAEQKCAFASAFYNYLRELVPADSSSRLFEHSLAGLSFLVAFTETNDVNRVGPLTEVSMCDPLTFARILDPVTISGSSKVYNRKSLTDRMRGGPMFVETSPYSNLSEQDLKTDTTMKLLRVHMPFSDETYVCQPAKERKNKASSSVRTYFLPMDKKSESVDPDILAKTVGPEIARMSIVDVRPTKEAIIVCLDTSSSMCKYSFWDNEPANSSSAATPKFKLSEIHAELQRLRDDPYLPYYKRLARRSPQALAIRNVLFELSNQGPLRKALVQEHKDAVERLLLEGELPPESDDEDETPKVKVPKHGRSFQIFVKTQQKTLTIDVDSSFTIKDVIAAVCYKLNENNPLRLSYAGKILDDNKTLKQLHIPAEATLMCFHSFANGKKVTYTVIDSSGHTYAITIRNNKRVIDLKFKIWEKCGDCPSRCSLWTNLRNAGDGFRIGTLLEDNAHLYNYDIDKIEVAGLYKKDVSRLTRIDTVKQLFHAFINRIQAYDYATQIGLLIFDSNLEYACPLTPVLENFRDHVDMVTPNGETRLYDALKFAADELWQFKQSNPDVKLRILCLTDGEDTNSTASPWSVAQLLQQREIICDSIMIGAGAKNSTLRAISKATGGYAFAPKTLPDALKLNELETLLTVFERPDPVPRERVCDATSLQRFADLWVYPLDECTDETVPQRKLPKELKAAVLTIDKVVSEEIKAMEKKQEQQQISQNIEKTRTRRLMKELSHLLKNPHPAFDIYPNRDDISFWKVIMEAPDASPYRGGTWLMYISFPPTYPLVAPEVRFVTPIRHCNVNHYGKICHSIFTRNWTADTSMATVLACIYGLLLNPDVDDPLDTTLALQYFDNSGQYEASIMQHVAKYAQTKTRAAWKRELLEAESN